MNGTYKYKHQTYVSGIRTYVEHTMRVSIERAKGNRYQVKYLGFHANGSAVGSLHWVRKDHVKPDGIVEADLGAAPEVKPPARELWTPYKD